MIRLYKENLPRLQTGDLTIKQLCKSNSLPYPWARRLLSKLGLKINKPTKKEVDEWNNLTEEEKTKRRKTLADKLDAGRGRMILESFLYTRNDLLTADRSDLAGTTIMTLEAYHDLFGFDGLGRTHYTQKELYDEASEYLEDLCYLQRAKKDLDNPSHWMSIPSHVRHLSRLYAKYAARIGQRIYDRVQLEETILHLALVITPKIIDQIGVTMSLSSGHGTPWGIDNMGRMQINRFNPKAFVEHGE